MKSVDKKDVIYDIAKLQSEYNMLVSAGKLTKKTMCDLVIPFRDKYNLSDLEALAIARCDDGDAKSYIGREQMFINHVKDC